MKADPRKLILLGAGNLAWHLGPALRDAGYRILQVFSRTEDHARSLASRLGVEWTTDEGGLNPEAGILLFCVSDRAIPELLCKIELRNVMMIHTAGSIPVDVFRGIAREYGVLYPVMTFSKERSLDVSAVPFCIEGSTPESTAVLEKMARKLSGRVCRMDSGQRKIIHLAGIIASNFSNHMYRLSGEMLRSEAMDFDLLRPLIRETALKVMEMDPASAQTGPAFRHDDDVVQEHIDLLRDNPELQKIYTFVSDSIRNHSRSR
jgi:predicted short-subunit dehydrogenase-like oxidoreductase (DUF2520 family)